MIEKLGKVIQTKEGRGERLGKRSKLLRKGEKKAKLSLRKKEKKAPLERPLKDRLVAA